MFSSAASFLFHTFFSFFCGQRGLFQYRLPRRARLLASLYLDLSMPHALFFSLVTSSSLLSHMFAHRRSSSIVVYHRHRRKAETIFRSWVSFSCGRGLLSFFVHGRRDSVKLTSVQVHRDRWRSSRVGKSGLLEIR
jgi:hypothetical protein